MHNGNGDEEIDTAIVEAEEGGPGRTLGFREDGLKGGVQAHSRDPVGAKVLANVYVWGVSGWWTGGCSSDGRRPCIDQHP